MYLLDTNAVIYFFKGVGRVADRLAAHPPGQIALPAIVLYELEVGIALSERPERRRTQLRRFLDVVQLIPFAAEEARAAANIRASLQARGELIGPLDVLIAATALARGATLVTHNVREFERVEGLRVEDWY